jgi:glycosyltransferase involved in cell wall biosynthesis
VPLEAQAAGRSLVASDLPGVREALGLGAGALVPPGNASALADALAPRLASPDLADAEGVLGRRNVEQRFDVRSSLARLAELTEEVVRAGISAGGD